MIVLYFVIMINWHSHFQPFNFYRAHTKLVDGAGKVNHDEIKPN